MTVQATPMMYLKTEDPRNCCHNVGEKWFTYVNRKLMNHEGKHVESYNFLRLLPYSDWVVYMTLFLMHVFLETYNGKYKSLWWYIQSSHTSQNLLIPENDSTFTYVHKSSSIFSILRFHLSEEWTHAFWLGGGNTLSMIHLYLTSHSTCAPYNVCHAIFLQHDASCATHPLMKWTVLVLPPNISLTRWSHCPTPPHQILSRLPRLQTTKLTMQTQIL